jgi:uncharacterized membrane protein YhaH (DUF805 family)
MQQLLFSFDGRIRRSTYWLYAIGSGLAYGVVAGIILACAGMLSHGQGGPIMMIGTLLYFVILVVAVWTGLALQIKRWHDRDKSWVWIFIAFIPLVGAIWSLIECGFLDGTPGPNKYGPSPKGLTGPAPVAT